MLNGAETVQAYARFHELFNRRAFWDAHEVLEQVWRQDRDPFKRGLIQYAAAMVHLSRDNRRGLALLLDRALQHLRPFSPQHDGFDVASLVAHAEACLAALPGIPRGERLEAHVPYPDLRWSTPPAVVP